MRSIILWLTGTVIAFTVSLAPADTVYQWTDQHGNTVLGDAPPTDARPSRRIEVIDRLPTVIVDPDRAGRQNRWAAPAESAASTPGPDPAETASETNPLRPAANNPVDAIFKPLQRQAWLLLLVPIATGMLGLGLRLALFAGLKGRAGEKAVAGLIRRSGLPALHDIVLPTDTGKLTQIDHLVRLPAALAVIETKAYSGLITGRMADRNWVQHFGTRKVKIGNPMRQNYGHIKAVKAIAPDVSVQGAVVYAANAKLGDHLPLEVMHLPGLKKWLAKEAQAQASENIDQAWRRIEQKARTDRRAHRQHLSELQAAHGKDHRQLLGWILIALGCAGLVLWYQLYRD